MKVLTINRLTVILVFVFVLSLLVTVIAIFGKNAEKQYVPPPVEIVLPEGGMV